MTGWFERFSSFKTRAFPKADFTFLLTSMSQFQFADEDPPSPANPPAPAQPPIAPPPAASPLPASSTKPAETPDDDFSFFAENPAPVASSTPPPPVVATPSQGKPGPPPSQVPPAPSTAAPAPLQPRPLQPRPNAAVPAPTRPASVPNAPAANQINVPSGQRTSDAPAPVTKPVPAGPDASSVADEAPTDAFSARIHELGLGVSRVLDTLEGPISWVLRVALPIGGLALAFLLAAIFTGSAANIKTNPTAVSLANNLSLAATVFGWCLVASALAAMLSAYEDNRLGAITVALGVALTFGAPLLLQQMVGLNLASAAISSHLVSAGKVLLAVGFIKALFDVGIFLWGLPSKMKTKHASIGANRPLEAKQRQIARDANMFSPCWQLPFCREAIRKMCPAWLARTTCWKFGRGCYCDEEMIARIVRGEPMESIKAPTKISQGKPPCGRCYIYLEHQTYKFRMLSPAVLPATIVICYFAYPLYQKFFSVFDQGLNALFKQMSFNPTSITPKDLVANSAAQEAVTKYGSDPATIAFFASTMIGVMLGFFLLIYLSKLVEWAIFKAKL